MRDDEDAEDAGPDAGGVRWIAHGRRDAAPRWQRRWSSARRGALLLGGAVVAVTLLPALTASEPGGLLQASLTLGWLGLLVMVAGLWEPARMRVHAGWVAEARPPLDDAGRRPAVARARCTCGWCGPDRHDAEAALGDAAGHARYVDPNVDRVQA